jgi:hypothetical protein
MPLHASEFFNENISPDKERQCPYGTARISIEKHDILRRELRGNKILHRLFDSMNQFFGVLLAEISSGK